MGTVQDNRKGGKGREKGAQGRASQDHQDIQRRGRADVLDAERRTQADKRDEEARNKIEQLREHLWYVHSATVSHSFPSFPIFPHRCKVSPTLRYHSRNQSKLHDNQPPNIQALTEPLKDQQIIAKLRTVKCKVEHLKRSYKSREAQVRTDLGTIEAELESLIDRYDTMQP